MSAAGATLAPLRVLHVTPTYLPAVRYGGPIRSVHDLCVGLREHGVQADVATTDVDGPGRSPVPLDRPACVDGVTVHYFSTGIGRRLYRSPAMARFLERSMAAYDLVHLNSVFLWPTSYAARCARRAGVPYLLAPRGMLVPELIERRGSARKRAWLALFGRRDLTGAAAIHVTSRREAEDLDRTGLPHARCVEIPNPVDAPGRECAVALEPALAGRVGEGEYFLCLGRISWKKGLERLPPALAAVARARLVIAGEDEDGTQMRVEALARRLGVAPRLRFVGPAWNEDKWALLRGAMGLVLPSRSENFANVVLEAMSQGCPVIVTPEVGLAGEVHACGAGRVVAGDPDAIAGALRELLADPAARTRMGEAGRTAARRFRRTEIAARALSVYRSLVPERGAR